jgi:hypothetical protein
MGLESQGMLLAAKSDAGHELLFLNDSPEGSVIR